MKLIFKITADYYLATDSGDFLVFKNRCTLMYMLANPRTVFFNCLAVVLGVLKGQFHEIFHLNFSSWNTSA